MNILKKNNNAILWLLSDDLQSIQNLKFEAKKRNVNPERLIFCNTVSISENINRYKFIPIIENMKIFESIQKEISTLEPKPKFASSLQEFQNLAQALVKEKDKKAADLYELILTTQTE